MFNDLKETEFVFYSQNIIEYWVIPVKREYVADEVYTM